jgi:amino acid transporter
MDQEASTWVIGVMMAVFTIVGITLAAGARDDGMYVFGWSLALFGILFIADLMRQAFAHAAAPVKVRDHG